MIVQESPLYFELGEEYNLLKLHNAMEEPNSMQHTKQTVDSPPQISYHLHYSADSSCFHLY